MDQYSQYLMLMKSKHIPNSRFQASGNSWEEQAFAEDVAAGPLGGFIWPPRSYSCSFCKREFRSAQALGGHMNVHRRDRARLKQSFSPPESSSTQLLLDHHHQNPNQDHSRSLDSQYPSQVCTLESNPNPSFVSSDLHSSSRVSVSAISSQENFSSENTILSPSTTTSIFQADLQHKSKSTSTIFEKIPEKEGNIFLGIDHDYVDTNLSVGTLNLISSQNQPSGAPNVHESISCKRHKNTSVSLSHFFSKPCSSERFSLNIIDDLDLELRLGDPPKVK